MSLVTNNISGSFHNNSTIGITGSIIVANQPGSNFPQLPGSDVSFFVSGTLNDRGTPQGKLSVFGGQLISSGAVYALGGISGSLTKLSDGTSYLVAGQNVTITTGSSGAVTVSSTAGDSYFSSTTSDAIFTSGSVAIRGSESIDSSYDKGADVFFYVSGSSTQKTLFGGDVVISGTLYGGSPLKISGGLQITGSLDATTSNLNVSSLSGSLTQLSDGTSYLIAGNNSSIVTGANGAVTISSIPAGSTTQLQYNNAGSFAGSSTLVFNSTGNILSSPNISATALTASSLIAAASTVNVFNTTATSVNIGSAATTIGIGGATSAVGVAGTGSFGKIAVASTSTFTGQTTHNGGISTTTLGASGASTFSSAVVINDTLTVRSGSLIQPITGTNGYSILVSGSNSKGGTNYIDFITATNTSAGISTPSKWFRLNTVGDFEIVNSAYSSVIHTIKDNGDATVVGSITTLSSSNLNAVIESMVNNNGSTGTVSFSLANSSIFYVNNPAGNITANFTGVPTTNNTIISTTVILSQSSTPRIVSAVQVDGVASTINWANGITPTGNSGKQDVFGFSLIRSGSAWKTLGQMSTFG